MEKKQYKAHYVPFASSRLIATRDFLFENLKPAGDYKKLDSIRRLLMLLFSKILESGQAIIGPVFSFQRGGPHHSLPLNWDSVINYLKEEKLIGGFHFAHLYHDEPKVNRIILTSSDKYLINSTDGRSPSPPCHGSGSSPDPEEAIAKTIGEFLERFTLLLYWERDLFRASTSELDRKGKFYLNIKELAGLSEAQKTRAFQFRFNSNDDFLWAEGKSLIRNKTCLIPAELIFWNYNSNHHNWREPLLREPNTNGAGGHYTLTKAILSGLYELIQRDGFLIYWLNKQGPPQIEFKLEEIDYEPLKKLLADYERLGFEVRFYNTTTDLDIPSCACTIFDHSGVGVKVSLGGSCGMDWEKILWDGLVETGAVYHWSREREENRKTGLYCLDKTYKPFSDFSLGRKERVNLWGNEKMFKNFQFFLNGRGQSLKELKVKCLKFSSAEKEIYYLIEKFKSLGDDYEIFYYQCNHKTLKDLNYFTVKVIVPGLVPLYLREAFAPLAAKRLKDVPKKLGFRLAEKWNPWPHPFP